ncbi:MAG: TIGR01212 family radical SAM protein [Eubacterium sp.]|nr:TIGR01212 family radical SAM protein [Eubacterium sp.]
MKYTTLNSYLKELFGCKVYKLALDGGFTCPNRDGTLGTRGCIFCSKGGSGDFAEDRSLSINEQIERGKARVSAKIKDGKYIAYFQAYTNTYAPVSELKSKFTKAINHPDIAALSIGTRPDCLSEDVIELLDELNKIKPVFVELGLQTIHKKSAEYIRRGYPLEVYDKAVEDLHSIGVNVVTHLIIGLPNESEEDILNSVKYVCRRTDGIKLQLLHILEGTDLADEYRAGRVKVLSLEEYCDLIVKCVSVIPERVVIHRLTGDGAKRDLIAPLWSADKKKVINAINKALSS